MKVLFKKKILIFCCIVLLTSKVYPILANEPSSIEINQKVEDSSIEEEINTSNVIYGVDDIEILQGSEFDAKFGVYIIGSNGEHVNDNIIVLGTVDTSKVGEYKLKYTYKDGDTIIAEAERSIKVISNAANDDTNSNEVNDLNIKIEGIRNLTVKLGEEIDLLDGIRAFDKDNIDITEFISVSGEVDTQKEGEYIVDYLINLGENEKIQVSRKIVVVDSKNIINVFTDEEDMKNKQLAFSIVLDEASNKLKFVNILDRKISSRNSNDTIFNMKIFRKDGVEKLNIDIEGNEKIQISKDDESIEESKIVKELGNFLYEDGDLIQISSNNIKEGFNITGDMIGDVSKEQEDYSDGVDFDDYISNVRFKISLGALETVYNNAPEIIGLSEMESLITNRYEQLQGISVVDDHDVNILNEKIQISNEEKDGEIIGLRYTVSDSWGRATSLVRNIVKVSQNRYLPKIEGADDINVKQGTIFNVLEGIKATDRWGNDITRRITTDGDLDTSKVGTYEIAYTVTDSEGNSTTKYRNIIVYSEAVISPKHSTPTLEQNSISNDRDEIDKYLLSLVTAYEENEDLTNKIKVVETDLKPDTIGSYTATYSVENSIGEETILEDFEVKVGRAISVNVPTNIPFQVVTNLKDKNRDPFIAAKLKIISNSSADLKIKVYSFEKLSGDFDIVSGDENYWDTLSSDDAMKNMALGIYVESGLTGGSFDKNNPLWFTNNFLGNSAYLGVIKKTSKAIISFVSKQGKNFNSGSSTAKFKLVLQFS